MRIRRGSGIEGIVLMIGYKKVLSAIIRGVKPTLKETEAHLDAVNR